MTLLLACEDIPCNKNMANPSLGIRFYKSDTSGLTTEPVFTKIEGIEVFNEIIPVDSFNVLARIPMMPYDTSMRLTIYYDVVMILKDTVKMEEKIDKWDSILVDTVLCETNPQDTCYNTQVWDSVPHYIYDTVPTIDTSYLSDFSHVLDIKYNSELLPVSSECGFVYEYELDTTFFTYQGLHIDTVVIDKKIITTPESIYEKEDFHINIYF